MDREDRMMYASGALGLLVMIVLTQIAAQFVEVPDLLSIALGAVGLLGGEWVYAKRNWS
jgi:hypothetical protein